MNSGGTDSAAAPEPCDDPVHSMGSSPHTEPDSHTGEPSVARPSAVDGGPDGDSDDEAPGTPADESPDEDQSAGPRPDGTGFVPL